MAMESWDDSLDKRSELARNRERERTRRPAKGKIGGESARNLLNSVLDDTAAAAEEERIRLEEARKRAEAEVEVTASDASLGYKSCLALLFSGAAVLLKYAWYLNKRMTKDEKE